MTTKNQKNPQNKTKRSFTKSQSKGPPKIKNSKTIKISNPAFTVQAHTHLAIMYSMMLATWKMCANTTAQRPTLRTHGVDTAEAPTLEIGIVANHMTSKTNAAQKQQTNANTMPA